MRRLVIFAAAAALVTAAGLTLGYAGVVLLGVAGLVVSAVALVWGLLPTLLDVERVVEPAVVPRGTGASDVLVVRNPTRLPQPPVVFVDSVAGTRSERRVGWLMPRAERADASTLRLERRGTVELGPLYALRHDPFGLWSRATPLDKTHEVLVVPVVHPVRALQSGGQHEVDADAELPLSGSSRFSSLREYVIGDDVRRVHWRTSARVGTPVVVEYVDTAVPSTVVMLDARTDSYTLDGASHPLLSEEAADVAASLCAASRRRGFRTVLRTTDGETLDSGGRRTPPTAFSHWLARQADVARPTALARATTTARLPARASVVLITGCGGQDLLESAAGLVRGVAQVAVCVVGARDDARLELSLPPQASVVAGRGAATLLESWDLRFAGVRR